MGRRVTFRVFFSDCISPSFFNSCFLLTTVIIPLVMVFVDSNKLVKSVTFSDEIIFVISDSRFLTNLVTFGLGLIR